LGPADQRQVPGGALGEQIEHDRIPRGLKQSADSQVQVDVHRIPPSVRPADARGAAPGWSPAIGTWRYLT
jgi:hypothetical protein